MRFHRLDINLLVALDALLAEQSVSAAAVRLNLTQPAISASLARLREYFGDEILVRVGRRMVPTALAIELAPRVRGVLQEIRDIAHLNTLFDPRQSDRRFYVASSDYVAAILLPEVRRRLAALAPGMNISARELSFGASGSTDAVQEILDRNRADFVVIPVSRQSPHHRSAPLFEDDFTCIAWTGNELVGETIGLDQYLDLQHVVREFGAQHFLSVDSEHLEQQGIRRKIATAVEHFSLIPEFVVGGNDIATVFSRLARLYARHYPLKLIAPPLVLPPMGQVVQWHAYQDTDPAVAWFRNLMQEVAAEI